MNDYRADKSIVTLALSKYAGVSPRIFDLLLREFGAVENIMLAEIPELLEIDGISQAMAEKIGQADQKLHSAAAYKKELKQRQIEITTRYDPAYPQRLFETNDPPLLLYSRGKFVDVEIKSVAICGADEATQEGIALTTALTKELTAKDIQIVSSLGIGIDSSVHISSRTAGGHSFAVLDKGLDSITGSAEVPLAIDIVKAGGIISEFAPETEAGPGRFQQINRLIAGLSQAVIVTEFYQNSTRTLDILEYCHQIGKLSFILIESKHGVLSDEASLAKAVAWGAIPMSGPNKIEQIVGALV